MGMFPYCCGSKFALEGSSEILAKKMHGFGIKVTTLAPDSFRTDWAGRSMVRAGRSIEDYDALFDPIRKAREEKSGRQNVDPAKAARVLLDLVAAEDPPQHLLLGADVPKQVREKLNSLQAEIAASKCISRSTNFV